MAEEYIYLVRLREFANKHEPTYKIGRTTRNVHTRINEYSLDTEVFVMLLVNDCVQIEHDIIKLFDNVFVKRKDLGLEYYSGDVNLMRDIIIALIQIDEKKRIALNQKPIIEKNLQLQQQILLDQKKQYRDGNLIPDILKNSTDLMEESNISETYSSVLCENEDKDNICISELPVQYSSFISDHLTINNINISNVPSKKEKVEKKTLKSFYKFIYDTKPDWYEEGTFVPVETIVDAYREYFNDENTHKSHISKYLRGGIFIKSSRFGPEGKIKKKLYTFEELKKHF